MRLPSCWPQVIPIPCRAPPDLHPGPATYPEDGDEPAQTHLLEGANLGIHRGVLCSGLCEEKRGAGQRGTVVDEKSGNPRLKQAKRCWRALMWVWVEVKHRSASHFLPHGRWEQGTCFQLRGWQWKCAPVQTSSSHSNTRSPAAFRGRDAFVSPSDIATMAASARPLAHQRRGED